MPILIRITATCNLILLASCVLAQSSNTKFDSLVAHTRQALLLEDVHQARYFIQLLPAKGETQAQHDILQSLILEKLVLEREFIEAYQYVGRNKKSMNTLVSLHANIMEGRILNDQGRFKESIEVLEKVKSRIPSKENVLQEEFLHWLGNSRMEVGDYKKADEYLRQAIAICKSDSSRLFIKLVQARMTRGANFKKSDNYHAAENEYKLAIHVLENIPIPKYRELSKAYINLGNVYNDQWNYAPAQKYYLKSLQLNQTHLTDSNQLTVLYNNMGMFYQKYGNLLKSKEFYNKWFALFNNRKQNFKNSGPSMLINYGAFLNGIQEYDHEFKVLYEAKELMPNDASAENQLRLLLARGHNFESMYQFDSTEVQLSKAAAIVLKHPEMNTYLRYIFYSQKSVLLSNTKNFSNADSLIQLAIQVLRQSDDYDDKTLADAYRIQGLNFLLQKRYADAASSFQRALLIVNKSLPAYHPQRIMLLNLIGASCLDNNESDSARHYLMLAVQANQFPVRNDEFSFSDPFEMLVSNFYLLRLAMQRDTGPLKEDEVFILSSNSIIENKRSALKSFEDQRAYNKAVRDFFDLAVEYYSRIFAQTKDPNYFDKAFETAEKSRYQSLQHALRHVRIGEFAGVTQKITSEEKALQQEIGLLGRQMIEEISLGADANADLLSEYNTRLTILQKRHQHVLDSLKKNLPGFYNLKFSMATVSPAAIKKDLLRDDMALIQYHVGYGKVHALIVTKENQYVILISDRERLLKSIRRLSNINKLRLSREFIPAAHELYKQLIQPVDSILSNKKINHYVLIPDGEINYVPFDVLITKPASELSQCKFLLSDKILSYGYSSTLLWQEFSGYSLGNKKLKILTYAPAFKAESNTSDDGLRGTAAKTRYATYDFQPLHMNVTEVKNISTIVEKRGFGNDAVLNDAADEASFKSRDLSQYQIIHLATHGFVDYPTTLSSGIAFSFNQDSGEDGILFMDEIFSLHCRAHLVCLSACQTGFGQVDVGEGMMSMTRAFLYAGVKNLVVSLWAVQDNSTSQLMQNFYKQFVKSKSISLSLRDAKLKMLRDGEFSHPYNWAGFIHVGLN